MTTRIGCDYLWYGINTYTNVAYLPVLTQYVTDLKLKFVRADIFWHFIEPVKGTFDWSKPDAFIAAIPSDVEILFTVYSSARWAINGGPMEANPIWMSAAPQNMQDYHNFVSAMAIRYAGKVKYYQIENEVYGAKRFWNSGDGLDLQGTKEDYLALLQTGSAAIRAADPTARIIISSIALAAVDIHLAIGHTQAELLVLYPQYTDTINFLYYIFANAASLVDLVDLHLYYTLDSIQSRLTWLAGFLLELGCVKPIWVTEIGALDSRAYADVWDDNLQAVDLVKRHVLVFGNGAERTSWLAVHKTSDSEGTGGVNWGAMRLTNDQYASAKRPSYNSLKTLVDKIDGFTAVAAISDGYKFTVNGKTVLVLWVASPKVVDVSGYFNQSTVLITGIPTGPSSEIVNADAVSITDIPLFVEDPPPAKRQFYTLKSSSRSRWRVYKVE